MRAACLSRRRLLPRPGQTLFPLSENMWPECAFQAFRFDEPQPALALPGLCLWVLVHKGFLLLAKGPVSRLVWSVSGVLQLPCKGPLGARFVDWRLQGLHALCDRLGVPGKGDHGCVHPVAIASAEPVFGHLVWAIIRFNWAQSM